MSELDVDTHINQPESSWVRVGFLLLAVSIVSGIIWGVIATFLGIESSSNSFLSLILPVMITGYYSGYKRSSIMDFDTRLKALLFHLFISLFFAYLVLSVMGLLYEISSLFGSDIAIILLITSLVTALMLVVQYFAMKASEKLGCRIRLKHDEMKIQN
ncbi:hypothetical protein [Photobacterium kagoshimensis]|uniref:hypothetical protein n=1 Tax=Photobacterium kagoshimensis TaxID=2910242 RepID=UPI003D14DE22